MGNRDLPMIGLTLLDDILTSPPPFLRIASIQPLSWVQDSSQVTLCVSSFMKQYFPESVGRVLKFETEEEFETIAQGLISKPLFLHVDMKFETKHRRVTVNFFVTVNTSHPVIKSQLLKWFNEARTHIKEGERVALEIDFNPILDDWFRDLIKQPNYCEVRGMLARHAKIVITNSSEYFQFFRCNPGCAVFGIACFPLFLTIYPAYRIYRKIRTTDIVAEIQGEVKHLTWKNGVPNAFANRLLNWKHRTTLMGIPVG